MRKWLTNNRAIKLAVAAALAAIGAFLAEEIGIKELIYSLTGCAITIFLRKGMAPERNTPKKKGGT